MVGTRRFADDNYHKRLSFVANIESRTARNSLRHLRIGRGKGRRYGSHVSHRRINRRRRIDHETYFTMIAQQRRIVLKEDCGNQADKREATKHNAASDQNLLPPGTKRQRRQPQQSRWNDAEKDNLCDQPQRQKVADFA